MGKTTTTKPSYYDLHPYHPEDAAREYGRRTLAARQLLDFFLSAREKHGDKWEDHIAAVEMYRADPLDLLLNLAEQLDEAGDELVKRLDRWGKQSERHTSLQATA